SCYKPSTASLRLDVALANGATGVIILLADEGAEFRAAGSDRKKSLRRKFRFDLGGLLRSGKPPRGLGHGFVRRLCRRHDAEPDVRLVVLEAGVRDGRHFRQLGDACR